jgi:hypothetical protein
MAIGWVLISPVMASLIGVRLDLRLATYQLLSQIIWQSAMKQLEDDKPTVVGGKEHL